MSIINVSDKSQIAVKIQNAVIKNNAFNIQLNLGNVILVSKITSITDDSIFFTASNNALVNESILLISEVLVNSHDFYFSLKNITLIDNLFKADFPGEISLKQNRDTYRVSVPNNLPITMDINIKGELKKFNAACISVNGISLINSDESNKKHLESGIISNCVLTLPDRNSYSIGLYYKNKTDIIKDRKNMTRIGFLFRHMNQNLGSALQRYINAIDLQKKEHED